MIKLDHNIMIEHLTWPEIESLQADGFDRAIFAAGSVEQHGPHLPLITDALAGLVIANQAALKIGKTLQVSTIRPGCSEAHMGFPGSMTISSQTFKMLLGDYCESLARQRFKTIIIVATHGGNFQPISEALPDLKRRAKGAQVIAYADLGRNLMVFKSVWDSLNITDATGGIHAGEAETSIMLYIAEELVRRDKIAVGYNKPLSSDYFKTIYEKGIKSLSKNGVLGDATKATKAKGKKYLDAYVDDVVALVKEQLK